MKILKPKLFIISLFLIFAFCGLNTVIATGEKKKIIVDSYSATVAWVTDKPSTSQVEYGRDAACGSRTEEDINLVTYHKVTLHNLTPATLYHYRVKSKDGLGNEAVSRNFTFATLKEPPRDAPPQISDVEAEAIVAAGPEAPVASGTAKKAGQLVKKEEPIQKALIQRGGLLLKKGKLQVEPSFTYAHVSANNITIDGYTILPVLVIGTIQKLETKRDILISTLAARYGLKDDLQLDFKVPFRYQFNRESSGSTSETTEKGGGLGDIQGGLFYQFAYEKGAMPDMICGVTVKSRTGREPYGRNIGTGTGHWAIKGSVVAVKSSDPAILFAKIGYGYNIQRKNIPNYGTIRPGDTYEYGMGVAFALNYQLAISLQLEQSIGTKMRLNHNPVPGSFTNVVNFKYGATWAINKNFSCEVSATNGLTTDAPSFVLDISFPYTF
jgi:hypothetical protein